MKKMKLYMLLLLVPLILMGCIEKGKPASGINVDVENSNPYSFSELMAMIDTPITHLERSKLLKNKADLDALSKKLNSNYNTFGAQKVTELSDYLYYSVYLPINGQASSFKYTTSLAQVEKFDNDLVGILKLKPYVNIVAIKEEIGKIWVANQTDTDLDKIYLSINSTVSNMDARKKENPFYALVYDLDLALELLSNSTNNAKLVSYAIDINTIDQKRNIKDALIILNSEIETLTNNVIIYQNKTTVLNNLKKLKVVYEDYIKGTQSYVNIQNMRIVVKDTEDSFSSSNSDLVNLYITKIDQLQTNLKNATFTDSDKDQKRRNLIERIYKYKLRNSEYANKNYLVIHSIVTNVLEEVAYLSGQNILGELGINPGW